MAKFLRDHRQRNDDSANEYYHQSKCLHAWSRPL
jgi:hypothetical protein